MLIDHYENIEEMLALLAPVGQQEDPIRRRLRIETYDEKTVFACLRADDPEGLLFWGFAGSQGRVTEKDWGKFVFFDMDGGGIGLLTKGDQVIGPVRLIRTEFFQVPGRKPRRYPPLRLAASNGKSVRPFRARPTRRR